MYYFALRNYGVNLIQNQGDLEGGIYQLTLAERFAPIDSTAAALRDGARAYIQAASYFGINWASAVEFFRKRSLWHLGWQYDRAAAAAHRVDATRRGALGKRRCLRCIRRIRRSRGLGELDASRRQDREPGVSSSASPPRRRRQSRRPQKRRSVEPTPESSPTP